MDVNQEIAKIEASIGFDRINAIGADALEIFARFAYFEYSQYNDLIVELNKLRKACKTYDEKAAFVPMYKAIYSSALKMYSKALKCVNTKAIEIKHGPINDSAEAVKDAIEHFLPDAGNIEFEESCYLVLSTAVRKQLFNVRDQLYILNNHPDDYINTFSTYIGPDSIMRYRNDQVFYKDISIIPTDGHSFSILYSEKTLPSTKIAILDIFAYLNGAQYFCFTENPEFNRKICELYENFDLLDMIKLRKKKYFTKLSDEPISLQLPILRPKNKRFLVEIPESAHEQVFALYHASLKQFEPLPRCIFLFRVFEYGAKHHYQKIVRPSNYNPKDAIEYYVSRVFSHNYMPLYYIVYGKSRVNASKSKIDIVKQSTCNNYLSRLKKETHFILKEWQTHSYLKSKSIGEIVYNTGRNAVAHASGEQIDARYDYGLNYQHINNVNILLELIARYIVEELNPDIVTLVDRDTKKYIKQSFLGV